MKTLFTIIICLFICVNGTSQEKSYSFYQLYQLDSIGNSPGISKHFGKLYFDFLTLVEQRLEKDDSTTKRLVRHFEMVFAQFYIDACYAYLNKEEIKLPAWRSYFSDSSLFFYQYYLLGANAHLNGGLAEAITESYTPDEWNYLRKKYVLFNKCLNITFKRVLAETKENNTKAKWLSVILLGFDKPLGQYYLYKWRKRQMRLTEYKFSKDPAYDKLLKKINHKKEKIDRLIFEKL